jgi:hypothetical protein
LIPSTAVKRHDHTSEGDAMGAQEIGALRALIFMLDSAAEGRPTLYDPIINARNIARELERTATKRRQKEPRRYLAAA